MYELVYMDDENEYPVRKSKGVSKVNIPNERNLFSDIAKLINESSVYVNEYKIRSKLHKITTSNYRKRALNAYDDKRCWMDVNFSLPYDH